jgi:NitT/TauT family transport system substrate-binding protein
MILRVAVLLGGLLAATAANAQALTKLRFTADWRFEGQTSYLHMAKAKGYFEKQGLDVQIDSGSGSTVAIQRIATGAYDVGLGDMSALIQFVGDNPEPRMKAVYQTYDHIPAVYGTLKKNGINAIADLAGKSIASGNFEVTKTLWPIIARYAKIDPNSVKWVTVDSPLRINMVLKGDAHAAGGFYSVVMDWNERGVRTEDIVLMPITDIGVRFYGNAVLASTKLIAENPKAVAAFLRAYNQAFKEGLADPAASVKFLKQRDPLIDEAVETRRFTLLIPSMITESTRANGLGDVDRAVLAKQVDEITSAFKTKTKPAADQLFTPEFLPPRAERMPPPR